MSLEHNIPRANIRPGQLIWEYMVIDPASSPHSLSEGPKLSTVARRILERLPVLKMAVVLRVKSDRLIVAHGTTFGGVSQTLPFGLEESHWYPIAPAAMTSKFQPLPPMENGKAQWFYINEVIEVFADTVTVVPRALSPDSLNKVYYAALEFNPTLRG